MSASQEYSWQIAEGEYKKLHVSLIDLDFVHHHAKHLLTHELFRGHEKGNEDLYNQQTAFVSALIVAYGRVFTRSKGMPKFPMALVQYTDEEQKLHDEWMKQRHKLFAHSDSESHRLFKSRTAIIKMIPMYHLKKDEVELIVVMATKLRNAVVRRINEIDAAEAQQPG